MRRLLIGVSLVVGCGSGGNGTYDVATTSTLTVMYMPDRSAIYGADTGNVAITNITSSMVDGTFAFSGSALGVAEALAVTGGSFHVTITRP